MSMLFYGFIRYLYISVLRAKPTACINKIIAITSFIPTKSSMGFMSESVPDISSTAPINANMCQQWNLSSLSSMESMNFKRPEKSSHIPKKRGIMFITIISLKSGKRESRNAVTPSATSHLEP